MMELAPGVAYRVADQLARDQPAVIKRPTPVVDLGESIPNDHRRVFIAGQLERKQIMRR
jgi:hypothetical protein